VHAVNKARLERDDAPLVIGCGPVGLAVIAALRLQGARPIVAADFSPRRRALAVPAAPAGGGVHGWAGVRGRGARTRKALMSTTRSLEHPRWYTVAASWQLEGKILIEGVRHAY